MVSGRRAVRYGSRVSHAFDATLGLERATNARDLGGHRTVDGRRVRRGLVYRADALSRLSDADLVRLGALGLACVVDFRHQVEITSGGADLLPATPPGRQVSLPLFDPEHDVFLTVSAVFTGRTGSAGLDRFVDGGGEAAMRDIYRWFVSSPMGREGFASTLRLIAEPGGLPLLFHCTAGKDRTGWASAVLLTALGVDRATVTADYLRTNELMQPENTARLLTQRGRVPDAGRILPLLEARTEYLDAAFDEAGHRYGSFDGYLREGLGLDDAVLDRLREILLEKSAETTG
jgi:protein-tyrosine phosphatase